MDCQWKITEEVSSEMDDGVDSRTHNCGADALFVVVNWTERAASTDVEECRESASVAGRVHVSPLTISISLPVLFYLSNQWKAVCTRRLMSTKRFLWITLRQLYNFASFNLTVNGKIFSEKFCIYAFMAAAMGTGTWSKWYFNVRNINGSNWKEVKKQKDKWKLKNCGTSRKRLIERG